MLSVNARAFSVASLLQLDNENSLSDVDQSENSTARKTPSAETKHESLRHGIDRQGRLHNPRYPDNSRSRDESHRKNADNEGRVCPIGLRLDIGAILCSRDLWREFAEHTTEMIITKVGRRMFPAVKVRLTGLNPDQYYMVYVTFEPVDNRRYRYNYSKAEWLSQSCSDPTRPDRQSCPAPTLPGRHLQRYIHPDSPGSGRLWLSQGIVAFDKLKLTNQWPTNKTNQIALRSMHKYRARVFVQPTSDLLSPLAEQLDPARAACFSYTDTEFITVTAYQNPEVIKLKIDSNPFAKHRSKSPIFRSGLNYPRIVSNEPDELSSGPLLRLKYRQHSLGMFDYNG